MAEDKKPGSLGSDYSLEMKKKSAAKSKNAFKQDVKGE